MITRRRTARRASRRAPDEDHAVERRGMVRWGRIWAGVALIAVGIIWLAVNNALGIYPTPATPAATPQAQAMPALGTAQRAGAALLTPKEVGTYPSVAGRQAPNGQRFLVIAVRVTSENASPIAVTPRQFSLRQQGAEQAGEALPGQHGALFARSLAPGATADGYLLFTTPASGASGVLRYAPAPASKARAIAWRVAP